MSESLFYFANHNLESVELEKALPPKPAKDKPLSEQRIKHGHRTPPKEYAEGGATEEKDYADPSRFKYPLDTSKHVRAAIAYFNKPKNYSMYSPEERSAMMGRMRRAAKKFGVEVSKEGRDVGQSKSMSEAWSLLKSMEEGSEETLNKSECLLEDAQVLLERLKGILKNRG